MADLHSIRGSKKIAVLNEPLDEPYSDKLQRRILYLLKKIKFTLAQAMKAQRGSGGIALLFL
jgi:hypothetical protein